MFVRYLIAFIFLCLAVPALSQSPWDSLFWNPQKLEGDIVLPAPCGASVAFRKVDTPVADNWLADQKIQMGNTGITGQEHSETVIERALVGGLTQGGAADRYFLIGKYEITRHQWQAVMTDTCPTPDDDGAIPADGMTWLDAQAFTQRYTEWLYANARDVLRDAAGTDAFLRLPTEEEWEFAARGGLRVTKAERRKRLFAMEGALEDYVWFSGFKSCNGDSQPIGILEANPLGLFDILGNVQELMIDLYRMRTRDRVHGQVGGAVARGGSCLTLETRMRVAARDEVPLLDPETGQPLGKAFTGLRPVIATTILRDQQRISTMNENWQGLSDSRIELDPNDDPINALGTIAEAQEDDVVRDALLGARNIFETEMERRNTIETRSAKATVEGGFLAVRSFVQNYDEEVRFEEVLATDPGNPDYLFFQKRQRERRCITETILFNSVVHTAEDFSRATVNDVVQIIRTENRNRLANMTARTRDTTEQILLLFAGFVDDYRQKIDQDPQEIVDALKRYHARLTGRSIDSIRGNRDSCF